MSNTNPAAQGAAENGCGITSHHHEVVRQCGCLWEPLDPANGMTKYNWHARVVSPSPATASARPWGCSRRVSPTCLACAPRRGPPVSAAAAGCTEMTGKGRAETGGHGRVGKNIRREAPDPRGFTFCHTCEMALTFSLKAGVRLGMAEGAEGRGCRGLAARTG